VGVGPAPPGAAVEAVGAGEPDEAGGEAGDAAVVELTAAGAGAVDDTGAGAVATGAGAVATGAGAVATGAEAVATGAEAVATGAEAVADALEGGPFLPMTIRKPRSSRVMAVHAD
jgi:hypothetical protein